MKKGTNRKCICRERVGRPVFRCRVCGEITSGSGLREHLASHHPGAANLSGEEVRNEFTVQPADEVTGRSDANNRKDGKKDMQALVAACVCLPAGAVDWQLLRKQKAVLAALVLDRATPGHLREVFEGVLSILDGIQDRAEPVLGTQAVFGRRYPREETIDGRRSTNKAAKHECTERRFRWNDGMN